MEPNKESCPMLPILISINKFKDTYVYREHFGKCSHKPKNTHVINVICMICGNAYCGGDYEEHYNSDNSHYIYYNISLKQFKNKKTQEPIDNEDLIKAFEEYSKDLLLCDEMNTISAQLNELAFEPKKPVEPLDHTKYQSNEKYKQFIFKLKNGEFKEIAVMTGAGLSTSAGIPDFRSSTGLFKQLQDKYKFKTPEEFFYLDTFLSHPEYFYNFCKEFKSEDYHPTPTHYFIGFLCHKGYLSVYYTQNIDGLDLRLGIPNEKLVFAHGNFEEGHCPKCQIAVDIKLIRECINNDKIYYCPKCKTPCKPNVVFYGENLSNRAMESFEQIRECDLGIIAGTSLKVGPFNTLPYMMNNESWRISINRSIIGDAHGPRRFQYDEPNSRDVFISSRTDEAIKQIVSDCGWTEDFLAFVDQTQKKYEKNKK